MNELQNFLNIDLIGVFVSVVTILIGFKSFVTLFEWFVNKLGLETKNMRIKREDRDLLLQTSQTLLSLQDKQDKDSKLSNLRDDEISNDVQKLTNMFIEKEIDDWRWKILDFSSALSNGRKYNRESYDHIIKIYNKYEKVLDENGLENGLVEESMKFIYRKYQDFLDKGNVEFSSELSINQINKM